MIGTDLIPRPWRRALIDNVYGAEDDRGLKIYMGLLWGGVLLLSLILTGLTPWAWPAEREGRVESLPPVTCEAVLGESEADARTQAAAEERPKSKSKAKAEARGACRRLLSEAERAQLARAEDTVTYLRRGGTTPQPLAVPPDSPVRAWIDSNICLLRGAEGADRDALAWHVGQGIGECGGWSRLIASLPLAILIGPILGSLLTLILLGGLIFLAARHSLRLPSTRRAYRRLYGSEHKAP